MQKITTFLWFDTQAEEAALFYTSIFRNSMITNTTRYGKAGPMREGSVMTVAFQLDGQEFIALNGGPEFKFTEAISLYVNCETQEEVDALWTRLTEGGEEVQCGWLKDRYGLCWQIVPNGLMELLYSPEAEKSKRATEAMFSMKKLDLAKIRRAYDGG